MKMLVSLPLVFLLSFPFSAVGSQRICRGHVPGNTAVGGGHDTDFEMTFESMNNPVFPGYHWRVRLQSPGGHNLGVLGIIVSKSTRTVSMVNPDLQMVWEVPIDPDDLKLNADLRTGSYSQPDSGFPSDISKRITTKLVCEFSPLELVVP